MNHQGYRLIIAPTARRQLAESLPEAVASAAYEFIVGPLLDNPHRVGKQLQPLADRYSARRGTYRVIYRIDDQRETVTVLTILPRRRRPAPAPAELIERRRHLPKVDPDLLRRDIDLVLDSEV